MTVRRTRAAALVALLALALLSGCGGFGSTEPLTTDRTITSYVALGDGFAAAPYTGRTSAKDGCLRSSANYAAQVAKTLGVTAFKDVSCVGATTKAITHPFRPAGASKPVRAQIDAVGPNTDLVTISIGIENSNLVGNVFRICVALPCGNEVPLVNFKDILPAISKSMTSVIRDVTTRAPHAYVVVVGYPELLPFANGCKTMPKMDATQWYWASQIWPQFSTAVGSSARQAGAAFVDVRKLTGAHPPCSKEPWVNGGASVAGRSVAYHPKADEQQVVAQAIADQVKTR
jgi:hypothetical protein